MPSPVNTGTPASLPVLSPRLSVAVPSGWDPIHPFCPPPRYLETSGAGFGLLCPGFLAGICEPGKETYGVEIAGVLPFLATWGRQLAPCDRGCTSQPCREPAGDLRLYTLFGLLPFFTEYFLVIKKKNP